MALAKTDVGQAAFKQRSTLFSTRQRSAFILFDGQKTVPQVLAATSGLGLTPGDVDHMVAQGFLRESAVVAALVVTLPPSPSPSPSPAPAPAPAQGARARGGA